jgi:hypothetical protein
MPFKVEVVSATTVWTAVENATCAARGLLDVVVDGPTTDTPGPVGQETGCMALCSMEAPVVVAVVSVDHDTTSVMLWSCRGGKEKQQGRCAAPGSDGKG